MLTKQEILNTLWDWAIVKKMPRSISHGQCKYRDGQGGKCFVGIFIKDEYCKLIFSNLAHQNGLEIPK